VGETVTHFDNPIRMVRELKGAPLSIVMVLSMVQQRVSQEYLERSTGYTDKPVSQALAYLQEIGLADHTRSGWQLIKSDRLQLPLPLALESENLRTVEPDPENKNADELSRNISDPLKLEEEVNLTNTLFNSSSDSLKAEQVGKIPTIDEIRKVLGAASDLFGHEIVGDPSDYADLDRLLSWIAQAQNRRGTGRGKIENPAGLVYWAFHKGRDRLPEKKYLDVEQLDRNLPESFMRDSGQWIFEDEVDE
jgi:hypothetical protein